MNETEPNDADPRPFCVSVAWHGERCRNRAQPGKSTCAWHDEETARRLGSSPRDGQSDRARADEQTGIDDWHAWRVQCHAVFKDTGERCGRWARKGQRVCGRHGGATAAAKANGERVMAERRLNHDLRRLSEKYALDPVDNPLQSMAGLAGQIFALKDYLQGRVEALGPDDWTYGDRLGIEQVRAEVILYERALERTVKVLTDMSRLNLDHRLARISERQGELVAIVLNRVLERLDLDSELGEQARRMLWQELERENERMSA